PGSLVLRALPSQSMKKPSAAMFPLALMFESLSPEGSKFLANAFGAAAGTRLACKRHIRAQCT
ncbi:MAG: hypothetical protein WA156_00930, partial [Methylocystis silviterrae]